MTKRKPLLPGENWGYNSPGNTRMVLVCLNESEWCIGYYRYHKSFPEVSKRESEERQPTGWMVGGHLSTSVTRWRDLPTVPIERQKEKMEVPLIRFIDGNGNETKRYLWQPPDGIGMGDVEELWQICNSRGFYISPATLTDLWLDYSDSAGAGWLDPKSMSEDEVFQIIQETDFTEYLRR